MNYVEWKQVVPQEITGDSLWKMAAYRLALFLSDICWQDVALLLRHRQRMHSPINRIALLAR